MSMHGPGFRPQGSNATPYAPGRDFAHVYPAMITSAAVAIDRDYWPEFYELYEASYKGDGPADEAMIRTIETYAQFMRACCDDPAETVDDVLRRVGWDDLDPASRMLWAAMLGAVVTGQLFGGLRDITPLGGPKPPHVDVALRELQDASRRGFNKLNREEDLVRQLKDILKMCRNAGLSYEEINQIVSDVKTGH